MPLPIPTSQHRDHGLGFLFFTYEWTDPSTDKTYEFETFVPKLGYCPKCTDCENNIDGGGSGGGGNCENILVTAETYHAGPSHSTDDEEIDEEEEDRVEMARVLVEIAAEMGE